MNELLQRFHDSRFLVTPTGFLDTGLWLSSILGNPKACIIALSRHSKKPSAASAARCIDFGITVRPNTCGIYPAAIRACIWKSRCGYTLQAVQRSESECLDCIVRRCLYTTHFARYEGECRKDVPITVISELAHGQRAGEGVNARGAGHADLPAREAIGFDEISIRKGHSYIGIT